MFSGKFVKKGNKLTYNSPQDRLVYEIFISKLSEGQVVDMYIDLATADHSKAQLAKVHACIRELAKESGYTFGEMKVLVKESCGLVNKSFADCSKDQLMLAIEACIEIGKDLNINLQ
jgi:hypothetical protein